MIEFVVLGIAVEERNTHRLRMLGVLTLRFEGELEWDNLKTKVTNNSDANRHIKPDFRRAGTSPGVLSPKQLT